MNHPSNVTQSLLSISFVMSALLAATSDAQAQGGTHGWNVDTAGHDRYVYKPEPWKPVEETPTETPSTGRITLEEFYAQQKEAEAEKARALEAERDAARDAELERELQKRKEVAIAKYATIGEFYQGLALVTLVVDSQTRYGFIAESYVEVIAPIYLSATTFESGNATVKALGGETFEINTAGKRQPRFATLFNVQRRRVRSASTLSPTDAKIASTL